LMASPPPFSWTSLSIHADVLLGVGLLAAAYALAWTRGPGRGVRQPTLFFGGLLVVLGALNGPLHDLSDSYLFSAHMVQHLLLTLVVPPLFIAGTPGWMLRPLLGRRVVGPSLRRITRPIPCFAIFNVVVAAWHLPPLYNTAMAFHPVHIAQHLMFLSAAVLMWWPVLSPLPELPR